MSDKPNRRSVLTHATLGVGAVTVGAGIWGLFRSTMPNAGAQIRPGVTVDLAEIPPGAQIRVPTHKWPFFVRHLTDAEVLQAKAEPDETWDTFANNANLARDAPAIFENRMLAGTPNFIALWGYCTRLGCVPIMGSGDYNGWFCPCGAAHYDLLGRIRKGPSSRNMFIPQYDLAQNGMLTLFAKPRGVNPADVDKLVFGG